MQYVWCWATCSLTYISQSAGLVWNKERQVYLKYNQRPILNVQQRFRFCQFTVGNKPVGKKPIPKKRVDLFLFTVCSPTTESFSLLLTGNSLHFFPFFFFLQSLSALWKSNERTIAWHLWMKQNQFTFESAILACFSLFLHKELKMAWWLNG